MLSVQLLIVFMIVAAVLAVGFKDMISSVIAIGALGLGLSLTFLILKSPDLAVILLIVEVVMLTFLVKSTISTSHVEPRSYDIPLVLAALLFAAFFLMLSYEAVRLIPRFGDPLMKTGRMFADEALSRANASNVLSSISLYFRGYDSLAGILILFGVTIGIKSITDKTRRRK